MHNAEIEGSNKLSSNGSASTKVVIIAVIKTRERFAGKRAERKRREVRKKAELPSRVFLSKNLCFPKLQPATVAKPSAKTTMHNAAKTILLLCSKNRSRIKRIINPSRKTIAAFPGINCSESRASLERKIFNLLG